MSVQKLILQDWVYLDGISEEEKKYVKEQLTVRYKAYDGTEVVLENFQDYGHKFGVPVEWALLNYTDVPVEDKTTRGEAFGSVVAMPDWNHPRAPEGQEKFFDSMVEAVQNHYCVLAVAETGTGKTVVGLALAATLRRKTLVIVPSETIGRQWVDEAKDKLKLTDDQIGWVQQDKCDHEGRSVVVTMIQSLSRREYPRSFYDSFGTVIWDECHLTGADTFRKTLPLFRATARIALTATPDRRDGCDVIYKDSFGDPKVQAEVASLPFDVKMITYDSGYIPMANKMTDTTMTSFLVKDDYRSAKIVKEIETMYKAGRHILAIGSRVAHLQKLMKMCEVVGVPPEDMGLFVGATIEETFVASVIKGTLKRGTKVRVPDGTIGVVRNGSAGKNRHGDDIVEVRQDGGEVLMYEKHELRKWSLQTIRRKVVEKELERIKKESRIIFATYGMFKMGVDVPRLDAGIDVMPRSEAIQVVGRIRRPMQGKPRPIWVTIDDLSFPRLRYRTKVRVKEYEQVGGKVVKIEEWKR